MSEIDQASLAIVGDKIDSTITVKGSSPVDKLSFLPMVDSGNHILVFVPGAFTPTCTSQIPEYISRASEFESKGINSIIFSTVNDAFVVSAWSKVLLEKVETPSQILKFVADDNGSLAKSLGLLLDLTVGLGGLRASRAAIIVKDGVITQIFVEEGTKTISITSAESVLAVL